MTFPGSFPALLGLPVTEAHARACREQGHATHTLDGVTQPRCPRCGEIRPEPIGYTLTEAGIAATGGPR